jgi:hypothetical protein
MSPLLSVVLAIFGSLDAALLAMIVFILTDHKERIFALEQEKHRRTS